MPENVSDAQPSSESAWKRLKNIRLSRRNVLKGAAVVGAGAILGESRVAQAGQIPPGAEKTSNNMEVPVEVLNVLVDTNTEELKTFGDKALKLAYPYGTDRKSEGTEKVASFMVTNGDNVGDQVTIAFVQTDSRTKVYMKDGERLTEIGWGLLNDNKLTFFRKDRPYEPGKDEVMTVDVFSREQQKNQLYLTGESAVRFADGKMKTFNFPEEYRPMLDKAFVQVETSMRLEGDKK